MTNIEAAPTATATAVPVDDPRILFGRAVTRGTAVVAAVRPDQLELSTPCTEYEVRGLLGHLVEVLDRVAAIGRGEDPFGPSGEAAVDDDGWLAAWTAAADRARAAWVDDAALDRIVILPWSQMSGGETLTSSYLSEVTVHTWDLATATGQHPQWDDDVVAAALAGMKKILPANRAEIFESVRQAMPPEMRGFEDPFGPVVQVGADAPLIDRLVAWAGRRP